MEKVVLVDMRDNAIGLEEKIAAHEKALLHRAFSVFLYHEDKILLQKRASHKYHCGGLWTNTCCSHPRNGEAVKDAAIRRLKEEVAIEVQDLEEIHSFVYNYPFANGLTEFEFDHILVGEFMGPYISNPEEVDEMKWVQIEELLADIQKNPKAYTPWFIVALMKVVEYIETR